MSSHRSHAQLPGKAASTPARRWENAGPLRDTPPSGTPTLEGSRKNSRGERILECAFKIKQTAETKTTKRIVDLPKQPWGNDEFPPLKRNSKYYANEEKTQSTESREQRPNKPRVSAVHRETLQLMKRGSFEKQNKQPTVEDIPDETIQSLPFLKISKQSKTQQVSENKKDNTRNTTRPGVSKPEITRDNTQQGPQRPRPTEPKQQKPARTEVQTDLGPVRKTVTLPQIEFREKLVPHAENKTGQKRIPRKTNNGPHTELATQGFSANNEHDGLQGRPASPTTDSLTDGGNQMNAPQQREEVGNSRVYSLGETLERLKAPGYAESLASSREPSVTPEHDKGSRNLGQELNKKETRNNREADMERKEQDAPETEQNSIYQPDIIQTRPVKKNPTNSNKHNQKKKTTPAPTAQIDTPPPGSLDSKINTPPRPTRQNKDRRMSSPAAPEPVPPTVGAPQQPQKAAQQEPSTQDSGEALVIPRREMPIIRKWGPTDDKAQTDKLKPKKSLKQQDDSQPPQEPEEKTEMLVYIPTAATLLCPACKTHNAHKSGKEGVTSQLVHHMHNECRAGKRRVAYGFKCRICEGEQEVIHTRMTKQGGTTMEWLKNHNENCYKRAANAKRDLTVTGILGVCKWCQEGFYEANTLTNHQNRYCRFNPQHKDYDPTTQPVIVAVERAELETLRERIRALEANPTQAANPENEQETERAEDPELASTPQINLPNFDCLRESQGSRAEITHAVMNWALPKITRTREDISHRPTRSVHETVQQDCREIEFQLEALPNGIFLTFPMKDSEGWKLVVLHKKGTSRSAMYLEPHLKPIPAEIDSYFRTKLNITWVNEETNMAKMPTAKAGENHDGGLIIFQQIARIFKFTDLQSLTVQLLRQTLIGWSDYDRARANPSTMRSLLDLHVKPPNESTEKNMKREITPEISKDIMNWFVRQTKLFETTGRALNQLEWIANMLATLGNNALRKNRAEFDKCIKYECPVAQTVESGTGCQGNPAEENKTRMNKAKQLEDWQLAGAYRANRTKVFAHIMNQRAVQCTIPPERLYKFFNDNATKPIINPGKMLELGKGWRELNPRQNLTRAFDCHEVLKMLKDSNKNSCPGGDGISYRDWEMIDPSGGMLTWIFNKCKDFKEVPPAWKESKTTLIFKNGNIADPANWRPIALMRTIYKLYTNLWNRRLKSIKGLTSPCQKGFTNRNGTSEHVTLLRDIIDTARSKGTQMSLAWLDLKNAFGSVPHEVITFVMQLNGLPGELIDIVRDIYKGCTTKVISMAGSTDPIPLDCGTKQGDPISPTLFNMCLELLLRPLEKESSGIHILGATHKVLAFADDLVILADSGKNLQKYLNLLAEAAGAINLTFKPAKCATLTIEKETGSVLPSTFRMYGEELPAKKSDEHYQYLGIDIGANNLTQASDLITALKEEGHQISQARTLSPVQQLDLLRDFTCSKFIYTFANGATSMAQLEELDMAHKQVVRKIAGLPSFSPEEYLFIAREKGGLGATPIHHFALVESLVTFLKRCWSDDSHTRKQIEQTLTQSVAEATGEGEVDLDEALEFINSKFDKRFTRYELGTTTYRLWSIHNHFERNKDALFYKFRTKLNNKEIELEIQLNEDPASIVRITKDKPDSANRIIKRLIREQIYKNWVKTGRKGARSLEALNASRHAHWFFDGMKPDLDYCELRFLLCARVGVLQLAGDRPKRELGKEPLWCGRCTSEEDRKKWETLDMRAKVLLMETTKHILNICRATRGNLITYRHNAVMHILLQAIRRGLKGKYEIMWDKVPDWAKVGDNERPDIIMEGRNGKGKKEVIIIDVTCPYEEDTSTMAAREKEKIDKYQQIKKRAEQLGKGRVTVLALVVGSRGGWHPPNDKTLELAGINKEEIPTIRRLMMRTTIKWSRYIYKKHKDGDLFQDLPPAAIDLAERLSYLKPSKTGKRQGTTPPDAPLTKIPRPN